MMLSPRMLSILAGVLLIIGTLAALFYYRHRAQTLEADLDEALATVQAMQQHANQLRDALAAYSRETAEIDSESRVTRGVIDRSYTNGQSGTAYLPGAVFDRLRERATATPAP
jgi:hypothetical protein